MKIVKRSAGVVAVAAALALVPASLGTTATQANWSKTYLAGQATSGSQCQLYTFFVSYVNYTKGQSGSTWNCWTAGTLTGKDTTLFTSGTGSSGDYFPSSGGRIGQADKSYSSWLNHTGSGTYQLYTLSNCGGAMQPFTSSWTSSTHWGSFKRSTMNCN